MLYEESGCLVKILSVDAGQSLSQQNDHRYSEHWLVLSGVATVELDGDTRILHAGESITIPAGRRHRILNKTDEPIRIAEVQYGAASDAGDIIGQVDRYGNELGRGGPALASLQPPITICEIGCNHMGDMSIAQEMVKVAAQFCKAAVVKFQKRSNRDLLTDEEYNSPHPVPSNAYGATYGEHRELLEFDLEQHRALKQWCEEWGVVYSTSVWDLTSAKQIAALEPQMIKIPSAINTNEEMLWYLYKEYPGEIHISLGMTTRKEASAIVEMADRAARAKDVTLYHCISGYPVEADEICLLELSRLIDEFADTVRNIGFSGHHRGIAADIAALTLGATHFERHFTLDRTWKGTDHAASLEPDGFRRLVRDLKSVQKSLRRKEVEILPVEEVQREKLKKVVPAEPRRSGR